MTDERGIELEIGHSGTDDAYHVRINGMDLAHAITADGIRLTDPNSHSFQTATVTFVLSSLVVR